MKFILTFLILTIIASCNLSSTKTINIYLANVDSFYIVQDEKFDIDKVQSCSLKDSALTNKWMSEFATKNNFVLLKPMTSFGGGGPIAEKIYDFCKILKSNSINYVMSKTDSIENVFFNDTSVMEEFEKRRQ